MICSPGLREFVDTRASARGKWWRYWTAHSVRMWVANYNNVFGGINIYPSTSVISRERHNRKAASLMETTNGKRGSQAAADYLTLISTSNPKGFGNQIHSALERHRGRAAAYPPERDPATADNFYYSSRTASRHLSSSAACSNSRPQWLGSGTPPHQQ